MGMTLKQLRSKLWWMAGSLKGKDPETGEIIPKSIWNDHLTFAQQEICRLGIVKSRWATWDLTVIDQIDYLLPSYCYNLLQVEVYDTDVSYYVPITGTTLFALNTTNTAWRGDSSAIIPTEWARPGKSWFIIHPAFDAAVTAGIKIIYERSGDTLTNDSDESYIQDDFREYIVTLAFIKMFPNHKDTPRYEREYARAYQDMKSYAHSLDKGHRHIIRAKSQGDI